MSVLGDFADFEMGQAPPGTECNTDGRGTVFVKAGEFAATHPIVREWTTKPLKFGRDGDVFVCVVGATAGKLNLGIDCAIGRSVAAIRPKQKLDTKFLYYQLQPWVLKLRAASAGSAQGVISKKQLAEIPIHVPDLEEQRRIVAEIDKQFSRLDEAVANLQRVKANLKRYKAAVLHAVTSGSLVSETGIPMQSHRWPWLTVEELASKEARSIQSGPFGSNLKHAEFQSTGKLVIGIDNVQDGRFSIGSNHRIRIEKFTELIKYKARPRDVLITVMATVGRVCVLPEDIEDAIITKHVYRISVNAAVALPEYVGIALRGSSEVRAQLMDSVQGQTRPGLNGGLIKKIRIPVPPLEDQERIVAEVDRQLSILRGVEAEVEANLRRAQVLRQSVLTKAFAS